MSELAESISLFISREFERKYSLYPISFVFDYDQHVDKSLVSDPIQDVSLYSAFGYIRLV